MLNVLKKCFHRLGQNSWSPSSWIDASVWKAGHSSSFLKRSAVIAEASPAQTCALSIHFEHVGNAFQIIDNVRDIHGSSYGGADI